ncbi:aminotransferase class V-fold PLP-dependent enzyme [Lutispora sp.]|uniref:aminotransferase class V-fold PLP-dependent enzyme n=1 Tax=Lutispora sp. TaxID=2828727 RepID=UPI002B1F6956|nr:aminotransferase class V-fold PLP-dependent enzyme [Lutispora sp.]MEA4960602.1 aminotransferase class V-fold PLP-dependent enzyme [Lutispora sp.]
MFENRGSPFRKLVAGVNTQVPIKNGVMTPYINFDNAATTPPFISVVNRIVDFSQWYSSIHRGTGYKSKASSEIYDSSRNSVLDFVGGSPDKDCVIYVKNTTEAINKLSNMYKDIYGGGVILSTSMEHHSNDLPWRNKFRVDYIDINKAGRLNMDDLERKLSYYRKNVRLVTVTGASNVTGFKNPIYHIARMAHKYGAKILVDGAQLVPHSSIDMKPHCSPEHIDYLVFSAHKMYAPFGIGVLIGPKETFEKCPPDYKGGGTVDLVTHDYVKWAKLPDKEEAGTPNVMGVAALMESINILSSIGMEHVDEYERRLTEYAVNSLYNIPDIDLCCTAEKTLDKVSIIPFNIKGLHHSQTARILSDEAGIGVRSGCFCAHPYVQRLLNVSHKQMEERKKGNLKNYPGFVRVSFGMYNTFDEIDVLALMLKNIVSNKDRYIKEYPL